MRPAISSLACVIGRYAVCLTVLAVVLAGGRSVLQPGRARVPAGAADAGLVTRASTSTSTSGSLSAGAGAGADHDDERARLASLARSDAAGVAMLSPGQIGERIDALRRSLVQEASRVPAPSAGTAQFAGRLAARYGRALRLEIGRQQLEYLLRVRAWVEGAANRDDALTQRELLHAEYVRTFEVYTRLKNAMEQMRPIDRLRLSLVARATLAEQRRELAGALLAFNEAWEAFEAHASLVRQSGSVTGPPPFVLDDAAIDAATAMLANRLAQVRLMADYDPLARYVTPVLRQLPLALALLLSGCAMVGLRQRLLRRAATAP